jgi:Uma2 family endonuclease
MGTKVQVSPEEYLSTSFDGLDREYVRGEIRERSLPTNLHSKTQGQLIGIFFILGRQRPIHTRPELRVRVAPRVFRVPDLSLFVGEEPQDPVPSFPPLIAIEVVSPDDRWSDLAEKLQEYWTWGVKHVWSVDPQMRKLYAYDSAGLHEIASFKAPELELELTPEQIF